MKESHMMGAVLGGALLASTAMAATVGVSPTNPKPLNAAQRKEVIITDEDALKNITFSKVFSTLIQSVDGQDSAGNRAAFAQTLYDTLLLKQAVNNGVTIKLTPRPNDASVKPTDLFNPASADGMRLTVATNRMDLAPGSARTCGEFRLVFAKGDGSDFVRRQFIIFEGAFPNPNPGAGIKGCFPVAKVWQGFKNLTGDKLAQAVTDFYLNGTTSKDEKGNTVKLKPVVTWQNYGAPFGQIRTNFFNDEPFWQLRQYRLAKTTANKSHLKFVMMPVANTPNPALYQAEEATDSLALKAMRKEFWDYLSTTAVPALVSLDKKSGNALTDQVLIYKLGLSVPSKFNTFESNASTPSGRPQADAFANAAPALKQQVAVALPGMKLADQPTVEDIFNRATSQACAGCHQDAVTKRIARSSNLLAEKMIPWPPSLNFVQTNEVGEVSVFVEEWQLPMRQAALETFISSGGKGAMDVAVPMVSAAAINDLNNVYNAAANGADSVTLSNGVSEPLDQALGEARDWERAQPGAFVEFRPTH